jgi:hypothetical protein
MTKASNREKTVEGALCDHESHLVAACGEDGGVAAGRFPRRIQRN